MKKLLICLFFATSCAQAPDVNINQSAQVPQSSNETKCPDSAMIGNVKYYYVYSESRNGYDCTTQCHIAQSKHDYCNDLKNDNLNNNCAKQERDKAYKQEKCDY